MNNQDVFFSLSYGSLDLAQIVFRIGEYIHAEPKFEYRVIVGSDSQEHQNDGQTIEFVSAIIIHRVGAGGIYFWQKENVRQKMALRQRIYDEAYRSLDLAQRLVKQFEVEGYLGNFHLEIHVDIGTAGETRNIINEVVGMIRGTGFEVKIKPDSYGASKVADRHT